MSQSEYFILLGRPVRRGPARLHPITGFCLDPDEYLPSGAAMRAFVDAGIVELARAKDVPVFDLTDAGRP